MNRSKLIRTYTDFIFVEDAPVRADILLIPGSPAAALGEKAAALYREGFAPKILVSGRYSICEEGLVIPEAELSAYPGSYATEAQFLAAVLEKNGVAAEDIWLEEQATYTYENAIFSRKLLDKKAYPVRRAILCCKPSHARRSLLYYQLLFPDQEILVCPCEHTITADNWYRSPEGIETVLGEIRRCAEQFGDILKSTLTVSPEET